MCTHNYATMSVVFILNRNVIGFFFFQSDANNVFGVIIIVLRFCTICGKHVSRQRDITCHHTTIVGPFPDTWYQMSLCNLLKPDLKLTESSVYWFQISCHFWIEIYCINYIIWVICLACDFCWLLISVTGSAEDVDADCGDVGAEELLHHHWHVPADPLLCSAGGHSVWHGQAWLQSGEVSIKQASRHRILKFMHHQIWKTDYAVRFQWINRGYSMFWCWI